MTSTNTCAIEVEAPKLRDSCDACAVSKLRCSKDKPVCARCARRNVLCEYVATKRGNKQNHSRKPDTNDDHGNSKSRATVASRRRGSPSQSQRHPSSASPSTSYTDPQPWSPTAPLSPAQRGDLWDFSDVFPDLHYPLHQDGSSAEVGMDLDFDIDSLAQASPAFPMMDMHNTDLFAVTRNASPGICANSRSGSEILFDTFPGLDGVVEVLPSPTPGHNMTESIGNGCDNSTTASWSSCPTDTTCSCRAQAVSLVHQYFPRGQDENGEVAASGPPRATLPDIPALIANNRTVIETVIKILKCSCSQDGFIIGIMSLVVIKLLCSYASAVHETIISGHSHSSNARTSPSHQSHTSERSSSSVGSSGSMPPSRSFVGEVDCPRMGVQLVLSELHRVHHLINQVFALLKQQATPPEPTSRMSDGGVSEACSELTTPLSGVMSEIFIADLKRRLESLLAEILEGLRNM